MVFTDIMDVTQLWYPSLFDVTDIVMDVGTCNLPVKGQSIRGLLCDDTFVSGLVSSVVSVMSRSVPLPFSLLRAEAIHSLIGGVIIFTVNERVS